jgi:hypothetical protein
MPHFDFYISDEERYKLIDFILSKEADLIVDKLYENKQYKTITSKNDFIENINQENVRYFLTHNSYFSENLDFLEIDFDGIKKYKISQRVGGPYIDIVFYLGYSVDAIVKCKPSVIDYYTKFQSKSNFEEFKVPNELKNFYKEIIDFIKKMCERYKINNKTYYVGKEALIEINFL